MTFDIERLPENEANRALLNYSRIRTISVVCLLYKRFQNEQDLFMSVKKSIFETVIWL